MNNKTINLDNVKITQKTLPLNVMTGFVEAVVDSCVDEITGEYMPQSYDLASIMPTADRRELYPRQIQVPLSALHSLTRRAVTETQGII